MAETWIKVRHNLVRSSKPRALMRALKCSKNEALGAALTWLCWVDEQTDDGLTYMLPDELDDELACPGLTAALVQIGWAAIAEDGTVIAVDYGKHCGASAKRRAQEARRIGEKRSARILSASNADKCTHQMRTKNEQSVRIECGQMYASNAYQRREEKNIIKEEKKVPSNTTVVLSADEPKKARAGKPTPSSADEVRDFMAGYGLCSLTGDELTNCAAGFFDEMEAAGWTGRNGAPVFDWQALARKYCRGWQQRSAAAAIAARKTQQPVAYRSELPKNYDL